MVGNGAKIGCTVCVFVVLAVVTVMFFLSQRVLEINELGLNYSFFGSNVEDKGYTNGRHLLGFGHSFLKFPSTVVTIEFSDDHDSDAPQLQSRTADGLEVRLEVSFQYQLNVTTIFQLYQKYGMDYHSMFVKIATDVLSEQATKHDAKFIMSTNRTTSAKLMEDAMKAEFTRDGFADIPNFQLRKVSLPKQFEDAIRVTEVTKQAIRTAEAERNKTLINMVTSVEQANKKAQEIALQADAEAKSIELSMNAYVAQFQKNQELQSDVMKDIIGKFQATEGRSLGISVTEKLGNWDPDTEDRFIKYLQTRVVRDHPTDKSIINLEVVKGSSSSRNREL